MCVYAHSYAHACVCKVQENISQCVMITWNLVSLEDHFKWEKEFKVMIIQWQEIKWKPQEFKT